MTVGNTFLNSAINRLTYYKELGEKAFDQLKDRDFHFQPNPENNSIAIIINHMAGNMLSRWTDFLTTDGEKDWRQRDTEFEIQNQSREEMMAYWQKGWACFLGTLQSLTEEDLLKIIYIRCEGLSAIDAINRQMAHYPYHVGQIIFIAKIIKDNDWQSLSIPKGKSNEFNKKMKP